MTDSANDADNGDDQPQARVDVTVAFDPHNLTWDDIEAVQSATVRSLLEQAAALAEVDPSKGGRIPIPIPVPHVKFSRHSKSHTKRMDTETNDTEPGLPVVPAERATYETSGDVTAWSDAPFVEAEDDDPLGRPKPRPPRPFSKSYSKHTKFGT